MSPLEKIPTRIVADHDDVGRRVEARNKGTAAELDKLGLAEYFAMEAYVVE